MAHSLGSGFGGQAAWVASFMQIGIPRKATPASAAARHASLGLQLLGLGVDRLAVGADAGAAQTADFEVSFGHILRIA